MTTQGAFVWYDLMTPDPDAAQAFYGSVVGWTARDSGMPGQAYTLFLVGERGVVGLMAMPEDVPPGMPPCWTGYVAVNDVDAMAADYAADGGKVLKSPQDIPGVGRFAVVADPQGAALCIFRGEGEEPPKPAPGAPGYVGWHELISSDAAAGFDFYAKHFGWSKLEALDMGEMGVYQMFGHEGEAIGGMMNRPPHIPVSYWGFYFNVPEIDAAVERVKAGGGHILHGPAPVPGGSVIAQCRDPQGAFFSLVAPQS
ncbi:MAG TPA: VOC family protein [Caulobacteraceae bacterium]|nr:VOC family protein [Caulobacteraceae bacterium]